VLVAGVLAAVRHLKQSSVEREGQQAAAATLKRLFAEAGLPVMPSTTHIVPLMVGDPVKAKKISDILLAEYGVYVQPINYPTVPRGTERLRFTPGPAHSEAMMKEDRGGNGGNEQRPQAHDRRRQLLADMGAYPPAEHRSCQHRQACAPIDHVEPQEDNARRKIGHCQHQRAGGEHVSRAYRRQQSVHRCHDQAHAPAEIATIDTEQNLRDDEGPWSDRHAAVQPLAGSEPEQHDQEREQQ
jgi:hypothetical protein